MRTGRTKFIVIPMGSAGDVHPLVWLAKLLQNRGHDVVIIAQQIVSDMPQHAGIRTISVGNRQEQEALIRHPHLWHPRKGFNLLASWIPRWAAEAMPPIRQELTPGETVLIAGALAFGARILSEALDIPLITVHLQPSVFITERLNRAPRWMRPAITKIVHMLVDQKLKRPVNRLRREAGADKTPINGVMKDWWNSPDGVLCLFPDWYAHKTPEWPRQSTLTRFPLYDESNTRPLDAALEKSLAHSEPPLVITPGSANVQAHRFLRHAIAAAKLLNRRTIVVAKSSDHLPSPLPLNVEAFDYVPFSQIFPHAAAVIHHGGIGTTAQCFAAGVPQLLMPMAYDQPDNAARIKHFHVGDFLQPRQFTPEKIAAKLKHLLDSPTTRTACHLIRQQMQNQMPPDSVADILEELAERGLRIRQINGPGVPC